MDNKSTLIFNKKLLIEFFTRLDEALTEKVFLYVIGGAAATIAYNAKDGTKDIDTWERESRIEKAYDSVIQNFPHLDLPLGPANVQIKSQAMLTRFSPTDQLKLKKLIVMVPPPEDLFLLKAQRSDEKDLVDLERLHGNKNLDSELILKRFKEDILPLNYANNEILVDRYLVAVFRAFGNDVAENHQKRINEEKGSL